MSAVSARALPTGGSGRPIGKPTTHPEQLSAAMSKRGAQSNLNKDNWEEQIDAEGSTEMGTWQKADEVRARPSR